MSESRQPNQFSNSPFCTSWLFFNWKINNRITFDVNPQLAVNSLFQYHLGKVHGQTSFHFCNLKSLPTLRSRHSNFVGVDVIAGSSPTLKYHKERNEESNDLSSTSRWHTGSEKHKLLIKYLGEFQYNQQGLQAKVGPPRQDPGLTPYKPMVSSSAASQTRPAQV